MWNIVSLKNVNKWKYDLIHLEGFAFSQVFIFALSILMTETDQFSLKYKNFKKDFPNTVI